MINIGIIGLGVGAYHLRGTKDLTNAVVTYVCDTNEEVLKKIAEEYHIQKTCTDYRDMIADPTIDAVIVATPDHLHCEMVTDALRAGKHVLCEKPIALHVDECRKMIEVAEEPHLHFEMTVADLMVDPLEYFDDTAVESLKIDASFGE